MQEVSFIYLLAGLGTINGLVFGIYLFFAPVGKRQANIFLGIFLVLISIRFLRSLHFHYYGPEYLPYLVGHAAFLLALPFIWFYYKASLEENFTLRPRHFIHLAPLTTLFINSFYLLNMVAFGWLLVYTLLAHRELLDVIRKEKPAGVHRKSHRYSWYRNLLYIIYLNIALYVINLKFQLFPYILGALSYSLIFYLMLFYWNSYQQFNKQKKIFQKLTTPGLDEAEAERYKELLFEKMVDEKLYTDPSLNLKKLAELLAIPYYRLSQLINQQLDKNFTEFINEYRIAEAKRMLANPEYAHEKIEGIAYDAGFNNPSSFYAAFKKFAHSTPSLYRKEALKKKKSSQDL